MSPQKALEKLQDLCNRSERCASELRRKLFAWRVSRVDADAIIQQLQTDGLLDDARFARAYAREKSQYAGWGRLKISIQLRALRIASDAIAAALAEIDPQEYAVTMRSLLQQRARQVPEGNTFEGRTRLFRWGLSRGYEPSLVAAIVKDPATWP